MVTSRVKFAFYIGVALGAAVLAGCPQNSQVGLPGPGSAPLHGQLYVLTEVFIGPSPSPSPPLNVSVFQGPFSAGTLLSGTISSGLTRPIGVAVDPTDANGKVFVSDNAAGDVQVYARPNPNGGAPLFALALPTASPKPFLIGFDTVGNLYVPNHVAGGNVYAFSHTVGSGSTGSALSLSPVGDPACVAADSSGNLYVVDFTLPNTLRMYGPSHSGTPLASTTSGLQNGDYCAVDPLNQDAYVASGDSSIGNVVGYASPLTDDASPAVTITWPAGEFPFAIGFDGAGNLYVAVVTFVSHTEVISVFSASSLTGTSVPASAAAFSFPNGQNLSIQLAIGP